MRKFNFRISLIIAVQFCTYSFAIENYYDILNRLNPKPLVTLELGKGIDNDDIGALFQDIDKALAQAKTDEDIFFVQEARDIFTDQNKKEEYDAFLKKYGNKISPNDIIFWSPLKDGHVLKQAHFDPFYGIINEFYINPDYPGQRLPIGIYFWSGEYKDRLIGKNKGYRVGPPSQRKGYRRDRQTGDYKSTGPTFVTYKESPAYANIPPLDNPELFQEIGSDHLGKYGWFAIPADGTNVKQPNAVLVRRLGARQVGSITGNPLDPKTLIPLPYGLWHWQTVPDLENSPVRAVPEGTPFRYDSKTGNWIDPLTEAVWIEKEQDKRFPNQATRQILRQTEKPSANS